MTSALPLRARNRLAETILAAFTDPQARRALETLAVAREPPPSWLTSDAGDHVPLLRARAQRALTALGGRALGSTAPALAETLEMAALLFDAGLYFETHELLEAPWRDARDDTREILQGLIQIAVGYQHRDNANLAGARALLDEGSRRLRGRRLDDLDLTTFAAAVLESLDDLSTPDIAPPFPRAEARTDDRAPRTGH